MQRENKEEEVERKIELKPEDMQKALEPHLSKMSTELDSKISPILEFINQQKEDRAQREQEAARTRQRERQVELEVKPEDYLDDPSGAMDKKLQPAYSAERSTRRGLHASGNFGEEGVLRQS